MYLFLSLSEDIFLIAFRETGVERETHQLAASGPAQTKNRTGNLGMCPDPDGNPGSPTNRATLARAILFIFNLFLFFLCKFC